MSLYYNPETTSSESQNHYQLTKHQWNREATAKQHPNHLKTIASHNILRSVTKFKRTNPVIKQIKPSSPLPVKIITNQELNSRISHPKGQEQYINDGFYDHNELSPNLATSRQMARTEEGRTILYVSPSKQPKILLSQRNSVTRSKINPQQDDMKSVRSFRSGRSSNLGYKAQNDNIIGYWKKKAHEYLQANFRMSEQISELKRQLQKSQISSLSKESTTSASQIRPQSPSQLPPSVPLHIVQMQQRNYQQQIVQLQITNRLKDSVIQNMQRKIMELTDKIKGQEQKSELMQRMRRQIEQLQQKNRKLSHQKQRVNKLSKISKVYQTEKVLNEIKQRSRAKGQEYYLGLPQAGDYKFEKDLQRQNRFRTLEE